MDYSENNDLSLYIHVPFCASKCLYCDFLSFSDKNAYFEDYKKAVINEIKSFTNKQKYKVNTIFIGGGTPSLMSENFICDILECIYNNFHITNNAEITIETNPVTVDKKKANCFKKAGINRVSIGLQAWQNNILKIIGRIHTRDSYAEFMFLGLRMIEGIERKSFKNEFGIDIDNVYKNEIEKNIKNGLLTDKNGVIKLTNKGIDLSNVVFAEFL